jgi:hypothetical protein
MTNTPPHRHGRDDDVEELAEEAIVENPDPQTRRETFELELMEEDESEEGEDVSLEDEAEEDG